MDTYAKLIKYLIVEIEIPAILGRMKLNVTFLRDGCRSVWMSKFFFKVEVEFSVIKGENQPAPWRIFKGTHETRERNKLY